MERSRVLPILLMLFGSLAVAGVYSVVTADSATYYYGSYRTGDGTCNDGGPCQPMLDANEYQRPIDANTYSPPIDAGSVMIPPTGAARGYPIVASGDAGQPEVVSSISIDPSTGNVTLSNGVTIDGRDISVDGTKLDGLPAQAVSQAQVNPADGGGVLGYYSGSGYGSGADVGVGIAACTVAVPNNSACKFKVTWQGKQVGDAATGLTPSAIGDVERVYHVRSGAAGIAAIAMTLGSGDSNGLTGTYAGTDFDGSVADPKIRGNGNPIWWTCIVHELQCNSI